MIIIKFLRFFFGYVQFTAYGGFPERFLNLCARNNIPLWSVSCTNGVLTAKTLARRYKKLRPIARKSGVRIKAGDRAGLPFILHRYRKRVGIAVGLVLFASVIFVLSLFVWTIEVRGNVTTETSEILSALSELGLYPGAPCNSFDPEMLKNEALLKLPSLSWLAITTKGSSVIIEVRERVIAPEIIPLDKPCNIKAIKSGQIILMEVYEGQPMVKKGDAVSEGSLLVSGVVSDTQGRSLLKHSRAKIIAQTTRVITVEQPYATVITEPTGNTIDRRSISFFGFEIPLYLSPPPEGKFDISSIEKPLEVFGAKLPISIKIKRYDEMSEIKQALSQDEAAALAESAVLAQEKIDLSGIKVIKRTPTVVKGEKSCTVTVEYICEENIGLEEEILLE